MSKNVNVNGKDYTGVSQVQLKTAEGGTALFKDVDEITVPSGTKTITENGTHDVTNYAQAVVNVESEAGDNDEYERFARLMTGEYAGKTLDNTSFAVPYGTTKLRNQMFYQVRNDGDAVIDVSIPDTVIEICAQAFDYAGTIRIGELPPNLETISGQAFKKARNIFGGATVLEIPASVVTLGALAFYQCDSGALATITFKGKPTSIANNALQNNVITTINVPWAEGEVENAPWGATNATINYNYTGA
jgi:hypothetical protein